MKSWKSVVPTLIAAMGIAFWALHGSPTVASESESDVPDPESCHPSQFIVPNPVINCPPGGIYEVNVQCARQCIDTYMDAWMAALAENCAQGMEAKNACLTGIEQCKAMYPDLSSIAFKNCKQEKIDAYLDQLDANLPALIAQLTQIQATYDACTPHCCVEIQHH